MQSEVFKMTLQTIFIIEDEIKIARFLELELIYEGYKVLHATDGRKGLEMVAENNVDLILLDVMLPSLNGMEICRRIRQHSNVPIIMLTAKDDIMDKVMGLDLGVDDYMTKPFAIEELLARIRVALKRSNSFINASHVITVEELCLNKQKYLVTFRGDPIDLTKREFDLLKYLMENHNIVLSRDKIMDTVWGYDHMGDTNVVDVYIRYLRSKIDDRYQKKLIHTIRGVGYVIKDE